jgi:FeS assembly SUF system protein
MNDTMQQYDPGFQSFMPGATEGEDTVANAGEPLDPSVKIAESGAVVAALSTVYDPEISVNIYDLGLIYSRDIDDVGAVSVKMTLTSPTCPVAGILPGQVADAVAAVEGVGEVTVELVWEPPWDQSMMSDVAKVELDMF